jgi:acetamidase/formamidase
MALSGAWLRRQSAAMQAIEASTPNIETITANEPAIIGGPTPIQAPRPGDTYRWKVQHGRAEKHVYVQIADALSPERFEEPLRSGIATKGESVLVKLLERGNVPTRIKITSAGITEVGVDRRPRACSV